jgi:protein O-mannosyl-transferase
MRQNHRPEQPAPLGGGPTPPTPPRGLSPGGMHPQRDGWPLVACLGILIAGSIAIYSRTFAVPMTYDDRFAIVDNTSIRHLQPISGVLFPPAEGVVGGRPLLNLSFALNYASGGLAVAGYHRVNLLIHILASLTLFGLVRRTLRRPVLAGRFGSFATPLGLAVAAIWAWHPVQTISVTYISQRAESLMGLFYLLTLYCFLRGAETGGKARRCAWFSFSVLACAAGLATKEVMATAPFMVLLYDRTFISGRFRDALRRNWPFYLALACTFVLMSPRIIGLGTRRLAFGVGFGGGIAWWDYALTECQVIPRYLLLTLWPHPLLFDYGETFHCRVNEAWPFALLMVALVVTCLVALWRLPAIGFAACWFFIILAPTSSIVPLIGQSMAENRIYLSLAGVVVLVAAGAFAAIGRRSLPVLCAIAIGLGIASYWRNLDYRSQESIWSDTVAKDPGNRRARYNLGCALMNVPGRMGDAIDQLKMAVLLNPTYTAAHFNLGCALLSVPGHSSEAVAEFREAVRLEPAYAEAHYNLGYTWLGMPGHLNDAIAQFRATLRYNPDFTAAHFNLGFALSKVPGHEQDAVTEFEEVLRVEPRNAGAHYNVGHALLSLPGRTDDAVTHLEEAVRLQPTYPEAHCYLGVALASTPGHLRDAVAQLILALRQKPDFADAHYQLALVLLKARGHAADAKTQLEAVLQLQPDNEAAKKLLGTIQAPPR